MEKFTTSLLTSLYSELQEVAMETENSLQQYERSFYIAEDKMRHLKGFMQSYNFKDIDEEIKFFKEIKPQFHKEVIYFNELFDLEADKPIASTESQKKYYKKTLERIMQYFDQHRELYNYYRSGKDAMDNIYFLRSEVRPPLRPIYVLDMDSSFSTPYSFTLARLQAYEQLCSHLNHVLFGNEKEGEVGIDNEKKNRTTWSGSKVALIELAIGLYFSGSVNFGKGGLNNFIQELESFFQLQLGNVYRVFLSMVLRKKDQTPFLHTLEDTVRRKLEEKVM